MDRRIAAMRKRGSMKITKKGHPNLHPFVRNPSGREEGPSPISSEGTILKQQGS
jgi:hypothetical protein